MYFNLFIFRLVFIIVSSSVVDTISQKNMSKKSNVFVDVMSFFKSKFMSPKVHPINDDDSKVEQKYDNSDSIDNIHLNETIIELFKEDPLVIDTNKLFNDAYFPQQLYLFPHIRTKNGNLVDMGIMHVWLLYKNFGYNVQVMVLGQGISRKHKDLRYNEAHSLDLTPKSKVKVDKKSIYWWQRISYDTNANAGIIGMGENDELCGVGIAPRAILSEVKYARLLTSLTIDLLLQAIEHSNRYADIALIIWKLNSTHHIFSDPNNINRLNRSFQLATTEGRKGNGVIYVVETGNYAYLGSNCAQYPLMNLIYTIGVTSSMFNGDPNPYMETCGAIMVTAFGTSSDPNNIVSTGFDNSCNYISISNTVGASMVTSIIALVLKAKPLLTWRDIQYQIAFTSQVHPLAHNKDLWIRNKAGFFVSKYFGFGLINAYSMLLLSSHEEYFPVPDMITCTIDILDMYRSKNPLQNDKTSLPLEYEFDSNCKYSTNDIQYIEHIQLQLSLKNSADKDITIKITSPAGTEIDMLNISHSQEHYELKDVSNWYVDSVMFWGETSVGKWKVNVTSQTNVSKVHVENLLLLVHGVNIKPKFYDDSEERRRKSSYFEPYPEI